MKSKPTTHNVWLLHSAWNGANDPGGNYFKVDIAYENSLSIEKISDDFIDFICR